MSYVSFTNLPASIEFPARSVAVGRELPAYLGKRWLTVLQILVAATEFLFVALAAHVAAFLYRRLILMSSPGPAKPEALRIAAPNLLVFDRAPSILPNSNAAPPCLLMERRQRRVPRLLLSREVYVNAH
jgi:hypothetical protein